MFTGHLYRRNCSFKSQHIATGCNIYGEWFETFQDSTTRVLRHITFTARQVSARFPDSVGPDGEPTEEALERFVSEQCRNGMVVVNVAFRDEGKPVEAACPVCNEPLFIHYNGIM